jgi:membrane-associated phospholipid phosphatase
MRARFLGGAALLLLPAVLPAQSVGKMLETDFRNFGGDVWAVWTSPFRSAPRDWMSVGLVIAGSAAISPFDDEVDRWMVRNKDEAAWSVLKEVREGGKAFSGTYLTPAAGLTLVYALATKNTKIQEGLFGCLASYTSGSVIRNYVVYYLIGRERPDSSRDDNVTSPPADQDDQYHFKIPGKSDWGMHSLPAGHAANIMSCATYLNTRFEMGYVEPALYALTLGIGAGRLVDRRHWSSDTFLGMGFGYVIGREIAKRSLSRAAAEGAAGAAASAISGAYFAPSRNGITLGWKTTF